MDRCIQLAKLAAGNVAPNPMVGAVLVYEDRIIGEGYHKKYGEAHAEVNCINSVCKEDEGLITSSTLYVSLEPCAHYGKMPPCADFIIKNKILRVVIGCRDPFSKVNGKGIEKLQQAKVNVTVGVLENECRELNKRFFTFHTKQRPFIILKWAQTANGKIALSSPASLHSKESLKQINNENSSHKRLVITNNLTNRIVHKWRSEEAAILVGTNTALIDNPQLNNRLWHGNNPIRLVIDLDLKLPLQLNLFDGKQTTLVFNRKQQSDELNTAISITELLLCKSVLFYQLKKSISTIKQITDACYKFNIQSIVIEGGAKLLQSFINEELWDEARIITNNSMYISNGLQAPGLKNFKHVRHENLLTDTINYFVKD